jgi:hypothetical protein
VAGLEGEDMDKHYGRAVLCATTAVAAMTLSSAWAELAGRFTGGGSFICVFPTVPYSQRVAHGFELHCGTGPNPEGLLPPGTNPPNPNNLEINFSGGDNFRLTSLFTAACFDDPGISSTPPVSSIDTIAGDGLGIFNGQPAEIRFRFHDAGEPGTNDRVIVVITQHGSDVLVCDNNLTSGNYQAHDATGSKK